MEERERQSGERYMLGCNSAYVLLRGVAMLGE
jgi:hypothetical protein